MELSFELLFEIGDINEKGLVEEGDIFEIKNFHIFFTESFGHLFKFIDSVSEITDLFFEPGVILGELMDLILVSFSWQLVVFEEFVVLGFEGLELVGEFGELLGFVDGG